MFRLGNDNMRNDSNYLLEKHVQCPWRRRHWF